jgi:hypothetical protein
VGQDSSPAADVHVGLFAVGHSGAKRGSWRTRPRGHPDLEVCPTLLQADQLSYRQRHHFARHLANHRGGVREGQRVSRDKMHDAARRARRRVRAHKSVDRLRQGFGAIDQRHRIAGHALDGIVQ